ncbi:twitching motility protein PilT [Stomatobaculum sp. F0698]|uniref:twitching motility protein PilT n=1 Tax=Stomatobaculum sp. F0698 TaxID=3059030 RepID=UPI00272D53D5|nr:twitching motility protein PilT [Stomatobaculum sp. F0698]WLD87576.1 twitching motility protein PilT [Stomatobaculum sp. F0698]
MVQIIVGVKGKGKTKRLLEMANEAVKDAKGTVVYLDKSAKHMYELSNKIRLINVNDFDIMSSDGFTGFVSGIISQDHDLETMFLDSFLKLANLEGGDITPVIDALEKIGEKYNVKFVLSVSMDAVDLPENAKKDVVVAL